MRSRIYEFTIMCSAFNLSFLHLHYSNTMPHSREVLSNASNTAGAEIYRVASLVSGWFTKLCDCRITLVSQIAFLLVRSHREGDCESPTLPGDSTCWMSASVGSHFSLMSPNFASGGFTPTQESRPCVFWQKNWNYSAAFIMGRLHQATGVSWHLRSGEISAKHGW